MKRHVSVLDLDSSASLVVFHLARRPLGSLCEQDILIHVLHNLNDELQAVHKRVDTDTQHTIRCSTVVDLQPVRRRTGNREISADKRGQLGVDLKSAEGGIR